MKLILAVLMVALLALQYKLWLGDGGVVQAHHLKARCSVLEQENAKLQIRNNALEADVMGLKSSGQALEEQARLELGMIKKGEDYYQFVN
ncbi:MAG: septum formation initiator family protein [Legionellales bacterium]|nr:septum formation initiator family protein [Legionellales bacterium]